MSKRARLLRRLEPKRERVLAAMGEVRRSGNKFLGSEQPKSRVNPNGFDPVARAKQLANLEVTARLQGAVERHDHG